MKKTDMQDIIKTISRITRLEIEINKRLKNGGKAKLLKAIKQPD